MSCERTEKISLLIDGEIGAEDARALESHLKGCLKCRLAREDFLLLRERVRDYALAADASATGRALENVLKRARAQAFERSADADPIRGARRSRFALPRFTYAHAPAAALIVLTFAVAAFWIWSMRDSSGDKSLATKTATRSDVERRGGEGMSDAPPASATFESRSSENVGGSSRPDISGASEDVSSFVPVEKEMRGPSFARRASPRVEDTETSAGNARFALRASVGESDSSSETPDDALAQFASVFEAAERGATGEVAHFRPELQADAFNDTARHLKQAQTLLRSFRNAHAESFEAIADERGRSQRLLYRNIALRSEAARAGNAPVARALDALEPILLDIANLPDEPHEEEVQAIRERMQRKNIVAVLQANLASAERAY